MNKQWKRGKNSVRSTRLQTCVSIKRTSRGMTCISKNSTDPVPVNPDTILIRETINQSPVSVLSSLDFANDHVTSIS